MKKLSILGFALAILLSSPAQARLVDAGLYAADLPPGWAFSQKNKITTFVSPDKDCVFIITEGLSVDAHKKRVAKIVASHPQITDAHPEQNVTVTRVYGLRVVVTILGDHRDRVPLYYSIKLKDENQAVPYR